MFARLSSKLAFAIGLYFVYFCGLTGLVEAVTSPETRAILGVVETLDGTPLPTVEVHLANGGSTITSELGKFSIPLSEHVQPGDPIELSFGEDWFVASPWQGKAFIPVSLSDVLHVRVTRKGASQLLADRRFVRRVVADIASRLSSKLTSFSDPDQALSEEAQTVGISVDQIKSAIDAWSKNVQTPYDKGLAALYARHYAEAVRYISEAISTPDVDQVDKYIALFDAE